ncbi:MAG: D-2-hydroxyacid dehydrogenase [Gammaproteobacteria bacterium]|nr:D-2-hydroxyacid dehydrogenase [Gammaproteobacteria bacterium]
MLFRRLAFLDLATVDRDDLDLNPIVSQAETVKMWPATDNEALRQHMQGAEAVVLNKVRLGAELFAAMQPKIVCLAATGSDNIDLEAARKAGVAVAHIRGYCTASVVQHVFALILALTTHLGGYAERLRAGAWSRSDHFTLLDLPVRELAGKTLTVIGYGTLGQAVAERARAFGMRIVAAERRGAATRPGRVPFEQALAEADVATLHAPLTEASRHLINTETLALMKPDALLINTARGGLVDEAALRGALASRRIGGAGLDVLSTEPPPRDHPLLDPALPNLIVTPHIAWAAREARQRAVDEIGANLAAFLAGESRNRLV